MAIRAKVQNPSIKKAVERLSSVVVEVALPAANASWFLTSTTMPAANADLAIASGDWTVRQPLFPYAPAFVVAENSTDTWTAVTATLTGVDQFGDTGTETITGTNSTGTWTCQAGKAYTKLNSATVAVTGTSDANDTVTVGFGKTVGLTAEIGSNADVLISTFDGVAEAGTVWAKNSVYTVAGTPNATKLSRIIVKPKIQ